MLNNTATLLNSKRKPSINRPRSNDNIKAWITKAPILSIYSKWTSSHWVPSICAINLMQVFLHENCVVHQGDSMYLDIFVDLVKLTESTWSDLCSHPRVLKLATYSFSFPIRSVIDASKEVNGPPYPFIHLPSDEATLIFHLAWRLKIWNITVLPSKVLLVLKKLYKESKNPPLLFLWPPQ